MKTTVLVQDGPQGTPAFKSLSGPDIAGIAYIPHCVDPPAHYAATRGMDLVFGSGNYEPPILNGPEDLIRYLATRREYRGAIMLSGIAASFDMAGQATSVSFTALEDRLGCGYTPFQILRFKPTTLPAPPPGSLQWAKSKMAHSKGMTKGGKRWDIVRAPGRVEIVHWQTFRLRGVVAASSYVITGYPAPFAWIQINYTLDMKKGCSAHVTGSSIPTIQMFRSWTALQRRCMLSNSPSQIQTFLAGNSAHRMAPSFGWKAKIVDESP
jgi:hypothetical protein